MSENINEQVIEERIRKQQRVGRSSAIYNTFLSQDMFGLPVTLSFQGRNKISTDFGAFCTLAVKVLIIIYITFLSTKMASHELDSIQATEH